MTLYPIPDPVPNLFPALAPALVEKVIGASAGGGERLRLRRMENLI